MALKVLVDVPFQAYDQLSRQYLVEHLVKNPDQLSHLFMVIGASTVLANIALIRPLQTRLSSQRIVQFALVTLTLSYVLLSNVTEYNMLLIIMPVQVSHSIALTSGLQVKSVNTCTLRIA